MCSDQLHFFRCHGLFFSPLNVTVFCAGLFRVFFYFCKCTANTAFYVLVKCAEHLTLLHVDRTRLRGAYFFYVFGTRGDKTEPTIGVLYFIVPGRDMEYQVIKCQAAYRPRCSAWVAFDRPMFLIYMPVSYIVAHFEPCFSQ